MAGDPNRKPIPKTLSAWQKERDGLIAFMAGLPEQTHEHGIKWVVNMRSYSEARIKALDRHKPKPRVRKRKN